MSFLPSQASVARIVPGEGNKDAKICLVGEAPGAQESSSLRPFVGPAGTVLDSCMQAAGIIRRQCYITNVVKVQPRGNLIAPYFSVNERTKVGTWTSQGREWLNNFYEEMKDVRANVIVALGATALHACTGDTRISKYRGYVMRGVPELGGRKVIAAYHPAATLRGQYILRYYIAADLSKAKLESEFPEIRRPQRRLVVPETLKECLDWLKYLRSCDTWACDIEVVNFEVSAIGFAPRTDLAISIPMYHEHWSLEEEAVIWKEIADLMGMRTITKVFQNGIFDVHFLRMRNGIVVAPPIDDTMIAHHIMSPEMLKGLGFLVSMYCGAQEYYKDMVKWDNIKGEA